MLKNQNHQQLLSEVLRPSSISELAIASTNAAVLEWCVQNKTVPNFMFHGESGIGKTSAAKIIASQFDTYTVNASDPRINRSIISAIEHFAFTLPMFGKTKLCVIDDGDCLPYSTEAKLRMLIEHTSSNCRFLITAKKKSPFLKAIQYCVASVEFSIPAAEEDEILSRYTATVQRKINALGYVVELSWLKSRIAENFPNFRAIANDIEYHLLAMKGMQDAAE
jgi:DNA polymerase III delta prime subunit